MIPQDRETLLSFIFSFNNVHDFLLIASPHLFHCFFSSLENHPKMDGCVFFPIPQRVERDTKAFQGCLLHSHQHFLLSSMSYYWSLMFVNILKLWLCTERFCQAVELICMLRLTLFFINCSGTSMHTKLAFEKLVVVPEQRNEKSWTSNIFFLIFKERHFTMKLNLKQFFKRVCHTQRPGEDHICVLFAERQSSEQFYHCFQKSNLKLPGKAFLFETTHGLLIWRSDE